MVGVPTDFLSEVSSLGARGDVTRPDSVLLLGTPLKKGLSSWLNEGVRVRRAALLTVADCTTLPETGLVVLVDLGSDLLDKVLLLYDCTEPAESDFTTEDPEAVRLDDGF